MKRLILATLSVFLFSTAALTQSASVLRNSNLRRGPSTQSKIVETLPKDSQVTIISKYPREGYVRVETADQAHVGWVLQKNVATNMQAAAAPLATPLAAKGEAQVGDAEIYPDSKRTPGAPDPSVTQANIKDNICSKDWTTSEVRPATSVTNKIKVQTMQAYGFTDAANHYELDHLMSLQDGGCPDCVENLWPEAYGDASHPMTEVERGQWNKANPGSTKILPGSLEKDLVENHVHDEVCYGIPNAKMSSLVKKYPPAMQITLDRGQQILATDWYACYQNMMDGNKPCK